MIAKKNEKNIHLFAILFTEKCYICKIVEQKSENIMRVLLTVFIWLSAMCSAQAQTKAQILQSITDAYAQAQESAANDGKGGNQRKCLDITQEFLFERNTSDELREDPLIYAFNREVREGKVDEKRYYWENEKLVQCDLSTPGELVEDEYMKETAAQYYKVFENAFMDISSRFY